MSSKVLPRRKSWLRQYGIGLLFLLPAFLVFGAFQWFPIFNNFIIAFMDYVPGNPSTWKGFDNYLAVLTDERLPKAALNTLIYVGICLLIGYLLPLVVSIAVSVLRKGRGFFRLAIYVPNIVPAIAVYIIWSWVFNPQFGLLNQILGWFGVDAQQWLLNKNLVLFSLAMMATWQNFGTTAVLYMASLTSINAELYEVAEIEGTSIWQRIWYITLPSLAPTMILLLILQLLATFQVLQEPFVMTAGGPNDSSLTLMLLTYQYAFDYIDFGKGGALGSVLFVFLIVLSFFYVRKSGLHKAKGM